MRAKGLKRFERGLSLNGKAAFRSKDRSEILQSLPIEMPESDVRALFWHRAQGEQGFGHANFGRRETLETRAAPGIHILNHPAPNDVIA